MSEAQDIAELERRLSKALERIGGALEGMSRVPTGESVAEEANAPADTGETAALKQALEEERLANAQLEERLKRLKIRSESAGGSLQKELDETKAAMRKLDADLQRLRRANDDLRAAAEELRTAAMENAADPHLINKSMLAELEALRAQRAADAGEAEAVLAAIKPLFEGAEPADAEKEEA